MEDGLLEGEVGGGGGRGLAGGEVSLRLPWKVTGCLHRASREHGVGSRKTKPTSVGGEPRESIFCTIGDRLRNSKKESNSMSCTWRARAIYLSPNQTRPVAPVTVVAKRVRVSLFLKKCMNSYGDKLYMKLVAFDEIYNFVVQTLFI
jgi:hypothetical protein